MYSRCGEFGDFTCGEDAPAALYKWDGFENYEAVVRTAAWPLQCTFHDKIRVTVGCSCAKWVQLVLKHFKPFSQV